MWENMVLLCLELKVCCWGSFLTDLNVRQVTLELKLGRYAGRKAGRAFTPLTSSSATDIDTRFFPFFVLEHLIY